MGNDKLEKYEALDFINEHIIEGLEKKIILQNKMHNDSRAEIKTIKQCYEGSKVKVKELQVEIRELKADNKRLYQEHKECRLVEQVSSDSGNSSSTHTHTKGKEIRDYMRHHPEYKEVRLFILPFEEFAEDGDYNHGVYWDDGIEV